MLMNTLKIREMTLEAGRPKVAVPIVSADPKDIIAECESVASMPCDMIEWRADRYLAGIGDADSVMGQKDFYLDMIKILDDINYIAAGKPVIFTIRSREQGGCIEMTDAHLADIRGLVAQSGLADIIDVELCGREGTIDEESLRRQIESIHSCSCLVMLSHHDFIGMPSAEDAIRIVRKMSELGADICKLAAVADSKEDDETLLKATAYLHRSGVGPLVMIAMGEAGTAARVAAGRYGSCITFAAGKEASAPGQADVWTMKKWLDDYYEGKES